MFQVLDAETDIPGSPSQKPRNLVGGGLQVSAKSNLDAINKVSTRLALIHVHQGPYKVLPGYDAYFASR